MAEEVIREAGETYIWRPGMPFNERNEPRNFLWRIQNYQKIHDGVNSITHLEDFTRACLELWERQAPFGIYNIANPGAVLTRKVVEMIQRILKPEQSFDFWKDDGEFYYYGAKALRSNCVLDVSKLLRTGIKMRPVEEALQDSLRSWRVAMPPLELAQSRTFPCFRPQSQVTNFDL